MEHENRRDFLKHGAQICAVCALSGCLGKSFAQESTDKQEKAPDPKELTYCGYKCSPECPIYKATVENSNELKEKVFTEWQWQERFGVEYSPEIVFCYGCKVKDKPKNVAISNCTVRTCAVDKKVDSCFQCKSLTECNKDLWTKYPEFKKQVVMMQEKYVTLGGNELI